MSIYDFPLYKRPKQAKEQFAKFIPSKEDLTALTLKGYVHFVNTPSNGVVYTQDAYQNRHSFDGIPSWVNHRGELSWHNKGEKIVDFSIVGKWLNITIPTTTENIALMQEHATIIARRLLLQQP